MLVASERVRLLEDLRVPYEIQPGAPGRCVTIARASGGNGAELISLGAAPGVEAAAYELSGAIVFTALADPRDFEATLSAAGKEWVDEIPVYDLTGIRRAGIKRARDGSAGIPFALDEPFDALLHERYVHRNGTGLEGLARGVYYRVRPALPYRLQMALRRRFRWFQERRTFPAWPIETSFHRLQGLLLALLGEMAGEPVPWLAAWPTPYIWAMVLTHDVERARGYERVDAVWKVEAVRDLRSAWYFVPERDYSVEGALLDKLRSEGCEICLHGLRHDGRDMSVHDFPHRLPAMRSYLDRWGALGFRTPATLRNFELIQELGIEHDSSWSDVARYEPEPGGTCSWLPFFIGDVVELPITLPMDHTLFELRRENATERWIEKAAFLRDHGGMALIVTHPDYLIEDRHLRAYEQFLDFSAGDASVWHALPREVAAWWRRRAESRIESNANGWAVVGPAASEAGIRLDVPPLPPPSAALDSRA